MLSSESPAMSLPPTKSPSSIIYELYDHFTSGLAKLVSLQIFMTTVF